MAASQSTTPAQPKRAPTWHGTIKNYFTPCEINCMRMAVQLDLSSYDDVKLHAQNIWEQVSEHNMPMGGPYWSDEWVQTFRDWMDAGFPQGIPQQLAGPTTLAAAMLAASPSRMRQDVANLGPADVDLLRTAFRGMMAKDPKTPEEAKNPDKSSYYYQASIHWYPLLFEGSQPREGYCMHHDPGFLPWHRAYLLSFENAMRQVPGCESIRLPFWDITQLAPDWLFAEPFASYTYPADLGPGYSKGDITTRNDASTIQTKMKAAGVYIYIFNSTKTGWWDDFNGYWSRAAYTTLIAAHDNGHNSTGSTMSDQSVASFDPIFWFFHCNWDRLWWVWQNAVQATSQNGMNQVIRKSTDPTSYALFNSTDEVAKLPPFPQLAVDTIDSAGSLDVGYGPPAVPPTGPVPAFRSMAVGTDENGTVDTDQVIVSVKGVNRLKIPGSFNVYLLKDGKRIATSGFFQPAEPDKCATCVRNAYAHFEFELPLAAITGGKLSVEFEPLKKDLVGTRISPQAIDNPTIEVQYPLRTE